MKIIIFIKQTFISAMIFFNYYLPDAIPLNAIPPSCISIINQRCKARPEIINISTNNSVFYPFGIRTNKCSGNCNKINDPYAKICVPDVVRNLKFKVFAKN